MAFFSRGKNKIQSPYCFKDMYADYIKDKPVDSPYYITYNEYVEYCSIFYKSISKLIIDDNYRFKLPGSLGEVYIIKRKLNYKHKPIIDWELTLKEGRKSYNFNHHTGGFSYKFFWTKPHRIKNKFMYRLVLTRTNKRYLAKAIKENKKDYFEKRY